MKSVTALLCLCLVASALAFDFEYGSLRFYSDDDCKDNEVIIGQGFAQGYCHKYYDTEAEASRYLKYDCERNRFRSYKNADCTDYVASGNLDRCAKYDDNNYFRFQCDGTRDTNDFALLIDYNLDGCAGGTFDNYVMELNTCYRSLAGVINNENESHLRTCNGEGTLNLKYYRDSNTCSNDPFLDNNYNSAECMALRQTTLCNWAAGLTDTDDTSSAARALPFAVVALVAALIALF